jgi:replicative DNA helicase
VDSGRRIRRRDRRCGTDQKFRRRVVRAFKEHIRKDFTQINPVLKDAFAQLREASERKDGLSGLSSGFGALRQDDERLAEERSGHHCARPAMERRRLSCRWLATSPSRTVLPVAIFSLEMANVQLVNRLIVNVCEIKGEKIRADSWRRMNGLSWI